MTRSSKHGDDASHYKVDLGLDDFAMALTHLSDAIGKITTTWNWMPIIGSKNSMAPAESKRAIEPNSFGLYPFIH